jgi:hypothetical protein
MTRTVFHAFFSWTAPPVYFRFCMPYTYLTFIDSKVLLTSQTYILSNDPVNLWEFWHKSGKCTCLLFARILPTEHHLASQEGTNGYATYQGMYEHNLYSLRYLCTFSYSKNNSKFTGSLLKIYVCDVSKTLLSMFIHTLIRSIAICSFLRSEVVFRR